MYVCIVLNTTVRVRIIASKPFWHLPPCETSTPVPPKMRVTSSLGFVAYNASSAHNTKKIQQRSTVIGMSAAKATLETAIRRSLEFHLGTEDERERELLVCAVLDAADTGTLRDVNDVAREFEDYLPDACFVPASGREELYDDILRSAYYVLVAVVVTFFFSLLVLSI